MDQQEEKPQGTRLPFYQRREFIPFCIFGGVLVFLLVSTAFSGPPPSIDRITQEDNLSCEILTIEGGNFGPGENSCRVRINDLTLAPSNYLSWTDNRIIVSVPREIPSGIVYVVTKNGKCLGDLYINPDEIPRLTSYRGPLIKSVNPETASPGRILVIAGERFGSERLSGVVSFTRTPAGQTDRTGENQADLFIDASAADCDFIAWTDAEIRVRIPDGARSGMLTVNTDKGRSNPHYISVMQPVGGREYPAKTAFTLRFTIDLSASGAPAPNALTFLLPKPGLYPEQRRIEIKKSSHPLSTQAAPQIMAVRLSNLPRTRPERISIDVSLERYEVRTEIDPSLVVPLYDVNEVFYKVFTGDDRIVQPSHPALQIFLWVALETETNPYLAAQRIYRAVIRDFSGDAAGNFAAGTAPDWFALLAGKKGDSFVYANLFTALARKAGIPARMVAGFLVDETKTARPHYWSEFYLADFGWVPADPYLGDNGAAGFTSGDASAADFYFGNLDSRHIALAKGLVEPDKEAADNVVRFRNNIPGLQPFHEESTAGFGAYEAVWNDPLLLEMY